MHTPSKLPDQSWRAATEIAQPGEVEGYLVDEVMKALGLRADSRWRCWIEPFITPLIRGFAQQAAAFDLSVARHGFQHTAKVWLDQWIPGLKVSGEEKLPLRGPLLIAANHPGTYDGLAISSVVARQDLKIVAAANPFLRALPSTRQYFIYSTLDAHVRMATIRNALRHLQSGGTLLIFPSGKLDPDPLYFKTAAQNALTRWSSSLEFFLRKIPEARLVVAINSGFVAAEYLRSPLARLRPNGVERQKLAEFIQVIQQVVFHHRISHQPSVIFTEPVSLCALSHNNSSVQAQVLETARRSLEGIPSGCVGKLPSRTRQSA